MNAEDFEHQLTQQPLRRIPAEWRSEILSAARQAARTGCERSATETVHRSTFSAFRFRLSALLWPCPQAWAGLGVIWLGILALHIASLPESQLSAKNTASRQTVVLMTMVEQRRYLYELLGPMDKPKAEATKAVVPRPRSERRIFSESA